MLLDTLKNLDREEMRTFLFELAREVETERASRIDRLIEAFSEISSHLKDLVQMQGEAGQKMDAMCESMDQMMKKEMPAPVVNLPAPVVNVPAPVVNLPAPVVKVQKQSTPPVDLAPIQEGIDAIQNALAALTAQEKTDDAATPGPLAVAKIKPRFRIVTETPTGAIDGSNTTYFLSRDWKKNHMLLFRNGIPQFEGTDKDYTRTGNKIVYFTPLSAAPLESHYALIIQTT